MTYTDFSPFVAVRDPFRTSSAPACGTGRVPYNPRQRDEFEAEEFASIDRPSYCPSGSTKFGVTMPVVTIACHYHDA